MPQSLFQLIDLVGLLAVAQSLWQSTASYYGEAHVLITINASRLLLRPRLTRDNLQGPDAMVRAGDVNAALGQSIITDPDPAASLTGATGVFISGLPLGGVAELAASVLNQLLRGLGASADLSLLRKAVEVLVSP